MSVEYKTYAGPEAMEKIFLYLDSIGEPRPNPVLSIAFTAEVDGIIKSIVVIQSLPFAEPAKAEPGYGKHLRPLFDMARDFIIKSGAPRLIAHTSNAAMAGMLDEAGADTYSPEEVFFDWRKPEVVTGNTEEILTVERG